MKRIGGIGFTALAVLSFACRTAPQESSASGENGPLILTSQSLSQGFMGGSTISLSIRQSPGGYLFLRWGTIRSK